MTTNTTPTAFTFTDTDTPDKTWSADKLAAFVRTVGKRTLSDKWRIGRAVVLATAFMTTRAERKAFIKDTLPGWSESTVYRLCKLAKQFKTADAVNENVKARKKTAAKNRAAAKTATAVAKIATEAATAEKVNAYDSALKLLAKIEATAPTVAAEVVKLRELLQSFAPTAPTLAA